MTNAKDKKAKPDNNDVKILSPTKWQIIGDTAAAILERSANLDNAKKRATEMIMAAHRDMWKFIEDKIGAKKDDALSLDTKNADVNILFVRRDDKKNGLDDLLAHLASKLRDDE